MNANTTQATLLAAPTSAPKHLIEAAQMTTTATTTNPNPIEAQRLATQLAPHGYQLSLVTDLIEGGQTYLTVRGKEVHCLPTLGDVQRFLERLECPGEALHYINGHTSNPARRAKKGVAA